MDPISMHTAQAKLSTFELWFWVCCVCVSVSVCVCVSCECGSCV
jgi:hypothetical protein